MAPWPPSGKENLGTRRLKTAEKRHLQELRCLQKHVKISSSIHSKLPGNVLLAAAVQPALISVEVVGFDDAVAQPVAAPIFGAYLPG